MREATQSVEAPKGPDGQVLPNEAGSGALAQRSERRSFETRRHDGAMAHSPSTDERKRRGDSADAAAGHDGARQTLIRPWADLLERAIEREVLPRLLRSRDGARPERSAASAEEVERFVGWLVEDAMEPARAMADALVARGADRDRLIATLLTPAARLLGVLWEEDRCDFATVTMSVLRLGEILRETAAKAPAISLLRDPDRNVLLATAPGEQHDFGVTVLADSFGRAGGTVRAETATTRAHLIKVVRDDWFDLLGLSVSAERWLAGLPAVIRTLRRVARNQALRIMVGGQAFVDHPERADFVGADAFAGDVAEAITLAGALVPASRAAH